MNKNPYESHEAIYRKMQALGIACWEEFIKNPHRGGVEVQLERFLKDVLAQPWAPRRGRVIELGCGTGPVLRWFARRGFCGMGIDISKTAVAMARRQSRGRGLRFVQGDVCVPIDKRAETYDVVVDGHCLHCIYRRKDRKKFLQNARRLLKKGGLFIVETMCSPVDRRAMRKKFKSRLIGGVVYVPSADARQYQDWRMIGGKPHTPVRYMGHWKSILQELRRAGFRPRLIRLNLPCDESPNGSVGIAAVARP